MEEEERRAMQEEAEGENRAFDPQSAAGAGYEEEV